MSDGRTQSAVRRGDILRLPFALGVMWAPVPARHRKTQPRQLTRRQRRSGPLLRRGQRGGQHAALCGPPPFPAPRGARRVLRPSAA